jgi:nucleotide-binding universal stress UspA family protein
VFTRILVPVDLTAKNRRAIRTALELAGHGGGEVTLLHVIETIADAGFDELESFYIKLEHEARRKLDELLVEVGAASAGVQKVIVYGNRIGEILRYSREQGVDLIVLSSHRLDPERPEVGWGTISHRAAILAECPVLLVK